MPVRVWVVLLEAAAYGRMHIGRFSAKDISRTAKERRAGSLGYAEAMLLAYNRKMRYPLRWGKLYNKKGVDDTGPDVETDMEPDDSEDD